MEQRCWIRAVGLAAVVAVLFLASCGQREIEHGPGGGVAGDGGGGPAQEQFDWSRPFNGTGVQIAGLAALDASKPSFPVYIPKLSDPMTIFAPPGPDGTADDYAVFFVYDDPRDGAVWVGESAPDLSGPESERIASYEARVMDNGQPEIGSTAEIVTIREGTTALMLTLDDISSLQWVEGGTQFYLLGPKLTRGRVLDIANAL